jgi:hypothetical protein
VNSTIARDPTPAGGRSRSPRAALAAAAAAVAVLLAALALGASCQPKGRQARDDRLVLLFAGNNDGVLAACGCPGNPSGGFGKRQGLIEQYRQTRPNVLVVDAGNLMPSMGHGVKARFLAQAAGRAGYDAVALGVAEFLLGVDFLHGLERKNDLPFLCANVRDARGELVAAPHVVRRAGGRTVGIFAVIGNWVYGFPPMEWRKGLQVEDPVAAARREAQALASCDLVVAVSHQPLEATRRLAAEVPGLHIVIAGHEPAVLAAPEKIGEALLVCANQTGSHLGALALSWAPDGRLQADLDVTFLTDRLPTAPWVEELYWAYVREAREEVPPARDTAVPARFETAEACAECHKRQYKQWLTTGHAHAYEVIEKAHREEDPECLLCHTMGFGRTGGFTSMRRTPGLGRVTCQACHIVTSDHKKMGVKPEPQVAISSRLCMSCHGTVQSPKFDYYVYKPKILHRAAGAAPAGPAAEPGP